METPRPSRFPAFTLGLLIGPFSLLLLGAALHVGATPSGWGYVTGLLLLSAGLLTKRWRAWRGLSRAGVAVLLLVAGERLLLVERGGLRTLDLPRASVRLLNRLVDERDGTLLMAHVLRRSGGVPRSDSREFIPALEAAFTRLERAEGPVATPAIATWLGLQSPDAFDAIVIPPEGGGTPDTAVVLLHGYMGNFAVYCWQMARAVQAISALTLCPSVGPRGDWWSAEGERTLEATYAWLVQRGVKRVYLGGLSNGGVGASVLVERARHPGLRLEGLVLLSGTSSEAPAPGVPVLLIQGAHDSMMPPRGMRTYARRMGQSATYVEVDSGHFAFLDRPDVVQEALSTWLRAREREAALRR